MPPKIRIILPAHNAEATIASTIASVISQTFVDWELIVVNDCSTDGTADVIQAFVRLDSRISMRKTQVQSTAPIARAVGLLDAEAEFIAIIDADDLWLPDKLALQYAALSQQLSAGMVYTWIDCIDCQGNYLRRGSHRICNGRILHQLIQLNVLECGSNPLIRRSTLALAGGFNCKLLSAGQDWELYLRLATIAEVICVPQVCVLYRVHRSASAKVLRMLKSCKLLIAEYANEFPHSARIGRANLLAYCIYLSMLKGFATISPWQRLQMYFAFAIVLRSLNLSTVLRYLLLGLKILTVNCSGIGVSHKHAQIALNFVKLD